MEVEVYGDLLFFINAGMDALCLSLTSRVLHRRSAAWRVLLAAAIGGVYAVLSLFWTVGTGLSLLLDAGMCLCMCAVAFAGRGTGGIGRFFLTSGVYFLLSMVLGGVMTALYHLLNRIGADTWFSGGEEGLGTWLFALLALLGGGITLWGSRIFHRAGSVRECMLVAEMDGRRVTLLGMVDTGNLLRDPMSGRVVVCVDRRSLAPLLSPALTRAMEGGGMDALSASADARRIRLIPARAATGDGMLFGVTPDRLTLSFSVKGREESREVDAILAATDELSDAQALVPAELLN